MDKIPLPRTSPKHEDQSLDSQNPCKNWVDVAAAYKPNIWKVETGSPE